MDTTILNELKQALLQQKAEVEQELAVISDPDRQDHVPGEYAAKFPNYGDDNPDDPGSDSPSEVESYQVNLAVTGELEQHLQKINSALARLAAGTYGKDIHTGADIAIERLRANPAAETALPPTPTKH